MKDEVLQMNQPTHIELMKNILNECNFNIANIGEVLNSPVPKIPFVLSGFKLGTVGILNAPGATGKSFFALQISLAIASDQNYKFIDGLEYISGRVAYITGEDDLGVIGLRLKAICKDFNQETIDAISNKLSIIDVISQGLKFLQCDGKNSLKKDEKAISIFESIASQNDLIILDTLSRFHCANENDNAQMSSLLSIFEMVAQKCNCSILILHHTNKSSATGNNQDQSSSRGASALVDNCRYMITLRKMSKDEAKKFFKDDEDPRRHYHIKCSFPKANYIKPLPDFWLERVDGGKLIQVEMPSKKTPKGNRYEK